jgi:F0F1-type ATP synthase assembly protein I
MLPHKHFLIAGIVILIAAIFFQVSVFEGILWTAIGGIAAMIIDFDAIIFANISDEFRQFSNPIDLSRRYNEFMNLLKSTGKIKILMITHILISVIVLAIAFFFLRNYFIPIVLGIGSHLATDAYSVIK